jgi:hypothetical protein
MGFIALVVSHCVAHSIYAGDESLSTHANQACQFGENNERRSTGNGAA